MASKRPREDSATPETNSSSATIFQSEPIKDRASTFIGLYSPTVPAYTLQKHESFKSASHRILAWRKPSAQKSLSQFSGSKFTRKVYEVGCDDDGEQYAGKKLEKVLTALDVEGSVVVARWYGGILLGPARFTHIENVAKEAIEKWQKSTSDGNSVKRQRFNKLPATDPVDEGKQKQRLIKQLPERDQSILVLRELLAEKQDLKLKDETGDSSPRSSKPLTTTAVVKPDYSSMTLQQLQQLDKARDATIGWILKQIDVTEKASHDSPTDANNTENDQRSS